MKNGTGGSATQLDVYDYAIILWRRRWVMLGVLVVTVALAGILSVLQTPEYQATATVLIQRQSSSSAFEQRGGVAINADLAAEIETEFFQGQAVKDLAQERLGYGGSATAASTGRGAVMEVKAVNTDPDKAAAIANAYAQAYLDARRESYVQDYAASAAAVQQKIDEVDRTIGEIQIADPDPSPASQAKLDALAAQKTTLERSLDELEVGQELSGAGGPQIIQQATVPKSPVKPNLRRDLLLGALVGLFLGVAAAFVVDYLDDSIKGRPDLEQATDAAAVLSIVPRLPDWRDTSSAYLVSLEQPASPTAEAYRTLRTSIQFADLQNPIRTLQITSPRSKDGKTTTACNLAVAMARAGQRVVLVDCDLRRPRVHEFFQVPNTVGFTTVLLGETTIPEAVHSVPGLERLKVLSAGPTPPNPSELLASTTTADMLAALRDAADLVLIDSPPVLPVSDALVLSDLVDAVIMVSAVRSTTKREAHRAWASLVQVDAPMIGTVMNGGQAGYGYGYGYNYGYDYGYVYGQEPEGKRRRRKKMADLEVTPRRMGDPQPSSDPMPGDAPAASAPTDPSGSSQG